MLKKIVIKGAKEHNLKNVSLEIPKEKLVVITGLSGSGKSSLAFDTIYAEGQRRYVESLSSYARQFLDKMKKPKVDLIEGLSPAISIEQKTLQKTRDQRLLLLLKYMTICVFCLLELGFPILLLQVNQSHHKRLHKLWIKLKSYQKNQLYIFTLR